MKHLKKMNEKAKESEHTRRFRLDATDFKTLVSGGVVKDYGLEIILADIGYDRMIEIIIESMNKK